MVPIRNQEESDFINNLLPFNSKYYWINVVKKGGEWIREGEKGEKVPEEAQNWAPEEPDDIAGQDCVEIYIKRDKETAKWNNESCRKRKGTACYTGKTLLIFFHGHIYCRLIIACEMRSLSVCMQPLVNRIPAVPMQTVWRP